MNKSGYALVAVAFVGIFVVHSFDPGLIRFKSYTSGEFAQQLMPLVLVALFIERGLEVFLKVWRGAQQAKIEHDVEKARTTAAADASKRVEVHNAEDALRGYKSTTQQIALPAALVLGILISTLGIRGLGALLDAEAFAKLPHSQQTWFTAMDVLLTGALLGGGSDFVHQFVTTFTDLMDATSKKAKA